MALHEVDPVDLTHLQEEEAGAQPPRKRRRQRLGDATKSAVLVDLTADDNDPSPRAPRSAAALAAGAAAAARAAVSRRSDGAFPLQQQQQQQQQQQLHPLHPASRAGLASSQASHMRQRRRQTSPACESDWAMAKRLQDEEDRRAAAAAQAEARLQRRFRDLEAAEAAAEAEEEAAAAERGGWGRGLLGWFGSGGGAAAAAAVAAGGPSLPRAVNRGPRSQRIRRGPAAEAEFAGAAASGALFGGPPMLLGGHGGRGARGGLLALQQIVEGMHRGLPPEMLLSGRDFTDADYERLLALDAGVQRRNLAPRERLAQLETVRVPARGAAAASPRGGSGGSSPQPQLDTCAICLEDARPGDSFRVLSCKHAFHRKCIDRWLTQERNSCPICNREAV